jgi:hypothetical protein
VVGHRPDERPAGGRLGGQPRGRLDWTWAVTGTYGAVGLVLAWALQRYGVRR